MLWNLAQNMRSHPAEREISMLQPKEFGECQDAAGALLESKVVIIDLSAATQGPAQRIIDFVSGTVYAIDGDFTGPEGCAKN